MHLDRQADLILPLAECADRPAALVGRKAATLAAIARDGLATPGGLVLTSEAFWSALAVCGVATRARYLAEAALRLDPDHVLGLGQAIRDGLAAPALDGAAGNAADQLVSRKPFALSLSKGSPSSERGVGFDKLSPNVIGSSASHENARTAPRIVCRSSAAMEDGRDAAFPGMFLSVLDLTSAAMLARAIAACWRSVFAETVLRYLLRVRPAPVDFSTALLVQPQVAAAWYGVCFSADPREPGGRMLAQLSDAGPEALVGGASATLTFVHENSRWHGDGDPPPGLDRLAEQARRLAERMGGPVDIEFALRRGDAAPVILQCRPITRGPAPAEEASGRAIVERRRGTPCAPGQAGGRAGAGVLAIERLGTGDYPAILAARALVVAAEVSPLSHVANLCRELGLPFVSGLGSVDGLGDRPLLVDGAAGELLILAAEADDVATTARMPCGEAAAIGATELILAILARAEPGDDPERLRGEVLGEYRRSLGAARLRIVADRKPELDPLLARLFGDSWPAALEG